MKAASIKKRMAARLSAVQSLFASNFSGEGMPIALDLLLNEQGLSPHYDETLRNALIADVCANKSQYEAMINAQLNKKSLDMMTPLLACLLICGVSELATHPDTDTAVIISSYISLGEEFFDEKHMHLINAILDNVAKIIRV